MLRATHSLPHSPAQMFAKLASRIQGAWESSLLFQAIVIGGSAWLLLILVLVAF